MQPRNFLSRFIGVNRQNYFYGRDDTMKNGKRLIAGILAAIMMISSVQLPSGIVYAAEMEIFEHETAVNENETISEENQTGIVEEQDDQTDTANEQNITVETSEDDDNDADESGETSTVSDDSIADEENISGDEENTENKDISSVEEIVISEDEIEHIFDEDIVETEASEFDADLSVTTSVDYDAVEKYMVKQLLAERKKILSRQR